MRRLTADWRRDIDEVARRAAEQAGPFDADFTRRFAEHFPALHPLFVELYGERDDGLDQLAAVIAEAAASWSARPRELRIARRCRASATPAGTCPTGCWAASATSTDTPGRSPGIRDSIPYFQELGLTYLHLMPLFESPEGNSDGGYAVSSYRRVNPALGTMDELAALAADLRAGGHLAGRGLHLQPHQQRARVGPQGGRRRAGLRGLLPDLPRPHDARCLRADRARDLPRRPPGLVRAAAGRAVDLGDVLSLPVGPELREPRGLPRDGQRDALPRESGRGGAADGCGGLHLEATRHAVRVAARGSPAAARVQRGAADGGAQPALQVGGDRPPGRGDRVHLARGVPAVVQPAADGADVGGAGDTRPAPAAACARTPACSASRHRVGQLRAQPRRHRLDVCRRGCRGARHRTAYATGDSSTTSTSGGSPAASRAACRSRRTRRPAMPASRALRHPSPVSRPATRRRRPRAPGARDRAVHRRHPAAVPRR